VDVLSPGTVRRDLGKKRDLYERHGVPEYWIVDPAGRAIEVLGRHLPRLHPSTMKKGPSCYL